VKQLVAPLPKLKYFEGMKMMNDMMKMNGDLDDMGMKMSMQRMDMNTVMYPEMEGKGMQHGDHQNMDHSATNMKEDNAHQQHQGMNHAEQNQDHSGHQNMAQHNQSETTATSHAQHQNSDIITLNYGMLRS